MNTFVSFICITCMHVHTNYCDSESENMQMIMQIPTLYPLVLPTFSTETRTKWSIQSSSKQGTRWKTLASTFVITLLEITLNTWFCLMLQSACWLTNFNKNFTIRNFCTVNKSWHFYHTSIKFSNIILHLLSIKE
jgi:hypothetical protein